jgi:molybdopterin molybdotransferase
MLSVEEARKRVLALMEELPSTEVPLLEADGLVLASDIHARFDIPALANSAMDGYAVRSDDQATVLRVVAQVQAGQMPLTPVEAGTAVRIMTGAPLPEGADAVVPFEMTDEPKLLAAGLPLTEVTIHEGPLSGQHIRPAGEDVARGSLVLKRGHLLDPPSIGSLASLGYAQVPVVRRPRVAILATGDEVQTPGESPEPGKLFDSNTYTVAAAVRRYGGIPQLLGIARDDRADLKAKLQQGLSADMLITSAGVSAGAFDMVKDALDDLGSISFWAVRMRPSRPLAFGTLQAPDGRMVPHLGLPGNPVSALVAMVQFGRPAMAKMMGRPPAPLPRIEAVLDEPIVNADGRRVYARVLLERRDGETHARLAGGQGSNLLTSLVMAQGLAICPEELSEKPAGARVTVEVLDWLDPWEQFNSVRLTE